VNGRAVDRFVALDELMAGVAGGDEEAFALLYDSVADLVFGLACRVVRDAARAEEVAQEVFLEVWQKAGRFDPRRGSATTYILTITHRRAVDFVRHEQSHKDRERRCAVSPDPPYDSVVEAVLHQAERNMLRARLRGLTELQIEALTLAYYDGYTYAQVASVLNVHPATVKTRLRDGLTRLREEMAAEH
jgi:RNA polymerase sigma-70 factor (ECF subfamily)